MQEGVGKLTEVPMFTEENEGRVPDMVIINNNSHCRPLPMTGMGQASCHTSHLDSLRRPAAILQSKEDPILFAYVRNVRQQEGEPSARDPTSTGRGEFRSLTLQAHTLHFFSVDPLRAPSPQHLRKPPHPLCL